MGFCSVMTDQLARMDPSGAARQLLRSIVKGEFNDSSVMRVHAAVMLGVMQWDHGDRAKAARAYTKCIEIEVSATADDRSQSVFATVNEPGNILLARDVKLVRASRDSKHIPVHVCTCHWFNPCWV
jgi:hypothetical protein